MSFTKFKNILKVFTRIFSSAHLHICTFKNLPIVFIAVFLSSCFSMKPVTFKQAENFSVANMMAAPEINLDLVFENPNSYSCTVKKIETSASVNNGNVFKYETEKSIRIKRKSEFTVPVQVNMPLEELLKIAPSVMNIFQNNQSVPFQLSGTITLKKFLFKKTFAFEWKN